MNKKFVIFLDILGFKNKIETGEGMNYIHSLKKLFEETEFFKTKNSFNFKTKTFSDNIFIELKEKEKRFHNENYAIRNESGIFDLLDELSSFQKKSILEYEVFYRGGCSYGELYSDENMIFGKGLLNAIKAEKEAKFPIITLEEELINQIEKIRDLYCEVEFSEKLKIYIIKYENKLFINYLNDYIVYKETLENHKRILENHLGIYSGNSDTDIRKKYVWLAKYHNYFVEKYGYTDKLCPENQRRIYNDKLLLINIID